MSEWVDDGCRGAERDYTETHGELAVYAFASGVSQAWCAGSRVPSDQSPTSLEGAKAAGEEALVAWVLIALERRAAAWADGIDARLAREYRAAAAAATLADADDDEEQSLRSLAGALAERRREREAMSALLRGWP